MNEIPNSASIGIVNGYEYPYELMEMMSTKKSLLLLKDEATILSMLQKGRIDYGILNLDDLKTLDVVLAQAGIQNKKQFTTIYKSKLQGYVGFSLQHPLGLKLKEQFDRGYQQIIQSKEKENILKRCKKEVF